MEALRIVKRRLSDVVYGKLPPAGRQRGDLIAVDTKSKAIKAELRAATASGPRR